MVYLPVSSVALGAPKEILYILAFSFNGKKVSFLLYLRFFFLSWYYVLDLGWKTCKLKLLYFWRNYRKSNFLSNITDLIVFRPPKLEIWAITWDSAWIAGSSGLIRTLSFNLLFALQISKTEFYALHMNCRPMSQIFKMMTNAWNGVV